jgi:hypothetical protein
MAFKSRDRSSFQPIPEDGQEAVIINRDGIQTMRIAVKLNLDASERAVWIFPIPASPGEGKVDISDNFPQLRGRDPRQSVKQSITDLTLISACTQIYPILPAALFMPSLLRGRERGSIEQSLDKWGMHCEVVRVESIEGLRALLKKADTNIVTEQIKSFEPYCSKDWALVLAWVTSETELLRQFPDYKEKQYLSYGRVPCVDVRFPAARPFYPMRPTGGYGSKAVYVRLYIMDYMQIAPECRIASLADIRHFKQSAADLKESAPELLKFFSPETAEIPYTRVTFNAEASKYVDDLWFEPTQPKGMKYAEVIEAFLFSPWLEALALLLNIGVLSYLSAGLAGLIVVGKWRGYAQLGLWNFLSLYGMYIIVRNLQDERGEKLRGEIKPILGTDITTYRRGFLFAFSVFFMVMTIGLGVIFQLPLG